MKDIKYEVFIGLNQKNTGKSFDVEFVKNLLNKEFTNYEINFSLNQQIGGYVHKDGKYVIEDGFKMTFVGERSKKEEAEFFNKVKRTFKQESILVIKEPIEAEFEGN